MAMVHRAYIGLGGNVGDREATLRRALVLLAAEPGVKVVRASGFIETAPVGPPQGKYLNAAAELQTSLSPRELLACLQRIEQALGRDRAKETRWGPRTCDLDIELFDDLIWSDDQLTIPHPRMHERAFVLIPLAEIAPNAMHPVLRKIVAQLLRDMEGRP